MEANLVSVGKHRGSRHGKQQELVETDQGWGHCPFRQLVLLGGAETPAQTSLLRVKDVHGLDAFHTCTYFTWAKIITCNQFAAISWFSHRSGHLPLAVVSSKFRHSRKYNNGESDLKEATTPNKP